MGFDSESGVPMRQRKGAHVNGDQGDAKFFVRTTYVCTYGYRMYVMFIHVGLQLDAN